MAFYAKLWTDILGDEKLMRAARKGAKHLVILPWLFAFAKKVDDNGRITVDGEPAEPDDISSLVPGITARQVAACFDELERIKVLVRDDDGALRLASWEERSGSGSKPSDAPESVADRVRRHRQKKRAATATIDSETPQTRTGVTPHVTRNETPSVTPRNAGETSYARSREEEEDVEEELDREIEPEKEEEGARVTSATRPELKRPPSSPASAALREKLKSPAHRSAFDRIAATVPTPETWTAEMAARLDGMHGPAITVQQLGETLTDYVANGCLARPTFKHFRGYLDNAARPREPRPATNGANGSAETREKPDWQLTEAERFDRAAEKIEREEREAKLRAVAGGNRR